MKDNLKQLEVVDSHDPAIDMSEVFIRESIEGDVLKGLARKADRN